LIRNKIEAQVTRSMGTRRWRKGRGFSRKEIREAGLPLNDTKQFNIPIDKRRDTVHLRNVQLLKRQCTVIPLTEIKGIGRESALELEEAGIKSIQDLIDCDVYLLSERIRRSAKTLNKWQLDAQRLMKDIIVSSE
jgi:hypothetical protein